MISAELGRLFTDPPSDFGPTPAWWWSGAKVTRERIAWQLRKFAEGGVHNLVIINLAPAGPSFGAQADDPAWFSEEWWARFADACELAGDLGTRLWFYDQIGFSGANVQGAITHRHPEAAGQAIRSRRAIIERGSVELRGGEVLLAAYRRDGERLPVTGTHEVAAPDGTEIRIVTVVPTAYDYLSVAAGALLLDAIHHEYDRRVPQFLGTVIAGSFQDELPATNSWTPSFPAEFLARRGYDLMDHLPALFEAGDAGSAKVRGDYYAVRAELTEQALFEPLARWHTERGMLVGCDQSNPARAGNPTQATQIYTDYFRTHRWYGAAGSDHEGDAKVHSSMAHLYGHRRVWIEAFHSSGWGGTLEDTYDWLLPFLRSGANLYNPHASYFGTAGGWFEWAPPSTDWRQPYWRQYPAFSRTVSRIASIMSWGSYSADVAVLHPTATVQALLPLDAPVDNFGDGQLGAGFAEIDKTQQDYRELCGATNWFATVPGTLNEAGVSFDVIDDASVQRAEVIDGALAVRDLRYRVVLLPSASVLEEGTARRLTDLLEGGGRVVVVGRAPASAAGTGGDDAVVAALAAHPRLERVADPEAGAKTVADAAGHVTGDVPLLVRRQGDFGAALVTGAFPNASAYPLRGDTWLWNDYDFDPSRYAQRSSVRVGGVVAEAEVWNPATGTQTPASVVVTGGHSTIEVPLHGAPAVIVVWREGQPAAVRPGTGPGDSQARPPVPVDISDGWRGRLVPTMDNTWGDLALPAGSPLDALQIWDLSWAEGEAAVAWQPARVTYGNRVRVLGPVPAAEAPPPLDAAEVAAVLAGKPLTEPGQGWRPSVYSASRGLLRPGYGSLGHKGMVGEEFVRVDVPAPGQVARVRAIVRTDRRGPAGLAVGAGAARRLWWNGRELPASDGYVTSVPVTVDHELNVIEYELAVSENGRPAFSLDPPSLGSFFCLTGPGGFGSRPTFMRAPDGASPDGQVSYLGRIRLDRDPDEAILVVGAATAVTVLLDGETVARQEKVEYYQGSFGARPAYFRHELTHALARGEHILELVCDSTDVLDVVFADLVVQSETTAASLVSGAGWLVRTNGSDVRSVEHRGRWGELQAVHAARRAHPLPATEWLTGSPLLGEPPDPILVTDDTRPASQRFRVTLPAGTISVELPAALAVTVRLDRVPHPITASRLTLAAPLSGPAELEVTTSPTAVLRGGSAWTGPLLVHTAEAPIQLGDWRAIGLGSWSGGVTYSRTVQVPTGPEPVLDLGRVRGSVEVSIDGRCVGEAFCGPYRFRLDEFAGREAFVEVTVYNTLAPYLVNATPTEWTFPSQLASGLLGPVRLIG
ncbi:MAG: glycosyl hydrolase [Streptosporangiaceae bacterium]